MTDSELAVLLREFLAEAEEHFETIDRRLLDMEQALGGSGEAPEDALDELFRATHTLKGLAAMFEFSEVKELAHRAESVFAALRKGSLALDQALLDLLFDVTAVLRAATVASGAGAGGDAGEAIAAAERIDVFLGEGGGTGERDGGERVLGEYTLERLAEAVANGLNGFVVRLRWGIEMRLGALSTSAVTAALGEGGEILEIIPDVEDVPGPAELDLETADLAFEVVVVTSRGAQALSDALGVSLGAIREIRPESAVRSEVEQEASRAAGRSRVVRVDLERLDQLMDLTGELITARTRLGQIASSLRERHPRDEGVSELQAAVKEITGLLGILQDDVMRMRMVPVEQLFAKFPRAVRDVARLQGKEIRLVTEGEETELDKRLVESIEDPLLHLIRNACDHGIESPFEREATGKPPQGTVTLSASQEGSRIVIEVADDGRGLDLSAIVRRAREADSDLPEDPTAEQIAEVIMSPGFSTSEQVTEFSGRGVGLDVVRRTVAELGGSVELESSQGAGTVFRLRLPLTLAIVPALLVESARRLFAVPLGAVSEVSRVRADDVSSVRGRRVLDHRGKTVPLLAVADVFGLDGADVSARSFVVQVDAGGERVGLRVDRLVGQQEIVVKNLEEALGTTRGIAGATILGDGSVVPIIDVEGVVRLARERQVAKAV